MFLFFFLELQDCLGVEEAYRYTDSVLTVSLHRHDIGFYPGTGSKDDVGVGPGKGFCVNIPLQKNLSDEALIQLFKKVMERKVMLFKE